MVSLRRQHQTHSVIHNARKSLHEELLGTDHVRIKDCYQLQQGNRAVSVSALGAVANSPGGYKALTVALKVACSYNMQ